MWGEARAEALSDMIGEYISDNLEQIVIDHLDRIKEIIAEIESEKEAKKE